MLRPRPAYLAAVYAFAVVMLGTTLPTPLYALYRDAYGFQTLLITVIFAVYAVGVIAGLLAFGALSDQIGRRPVLAGGAMLSALSAVAFLASQGLDGILVGRVLSGLSAGIFTGTATATVIELAPDRSRATPVANAANMGGLALGPVVAGVIAQDGPIPIRLPFIVDLGLVALAVLCVYAMPETVRRTRQPGERLRLQRLGIPGEVRARFARDALAGFVGFSLLGLFSSVAPSFLAEVIGVDSHLVAGLAAFSAFAATAVAQRLVAFLADENAMRAGCVLLIAALGAIAGALAGGSEALLFLGGVLAGLGNGLAFGGGLSELNAQAPTARRGEVQSTFFVVAYVGLIIPVLGVGIASQLTGLESAGLGFTAVIAVLAVGVLISLLLARSRRARTPIG